MHEIVHLQFGPRSNHLGTHVWNVADSQFAWADADEDYGVDLDVDWRQGVGRGVRSIARSSLFLGWRAAR